MTDSVFNSTKRSNICKRLEIFVFCKKNGKFGKNISKNFSRKYSQKLLDHAKQSATYPHKTAPKSEFKKQQKQLVI